MSKNPSIPTIAIVTGDYASTVPVAQILHQAGFHVEYFAHAADLVDNLANHCPDLALLDSPSVQMYSSWHTAEVLHEFGCAVIMFTTNSAALGEVGHTKRGNVFAGALRRPCYAHTLLATIDRVLREYPHFVAPPVPQPQNSSRWPILWHTLMRPFTAPQHDVRPAHELGVASGDGECTA